MHNLGIKNCEAGACCGQPDGNAFADSLASTGHNGYLSFEGIEAFIGHESSPFQRPRLIRFFAY